MARPKLRSPDQPKFVQAILWLYEFCASLKLAVVLISGSIIVLASGTIIEGKYDVRVSRFFIYESWWFGLLIALLALNIFCAASIRFPWKKHQTGFVITHAGLLCMLLGCALSRLGGVDGQIPIAEGGYGHQAVEDRAYFELKIPGRKSGGSHTQGNDSNDKSSANETVIQIPFQGGPFNWSDYGSSSGKLGFVSFLTGITRGLVYDRDGIQLEVLDYYADSELVQGPHVRLWLSTPPRSLSNDGDPALTTGESYAPVPLSINTNDDLAEHRFGIGDIQKRGGGEVVFMLGSGPAETNAFLNSAPTSPVDPQGVIVLYAKGTRHEIKLAELQAKKKLPLGDSGIEVELVKFARHGEPAASERHKSVAIAEQPTSEGAVDHPAVELNLHTEKSAPTRMVLFADYPSLSLQGYDAKIFGALWFDRGKLTAQQRMQGLSGARIDVLQGENEKHEPYLLYRYWNGHELVRVEPLPTDGTQVEAFKMPVATLHMYVDKFVPLVRPSLTFVPKGFTRNTPFVNTHRAAKVRLTVDEASKEFWIGGITEVGETRLALRKERLSSRGRTVDLTFPLETEDVRFMIKLLDFEMTLDPGTAQARTYSSFVELYNMNGAGDQADKGAKLTPKPLKITMNAPIDVVSPQSRQLYRLFQESFSGPYRPGDDEYERIVNLDSEKEQLYYSVLTVNYDPGRGWKYAGSFMITTGIAMMFYMRAYFFKPSAAPKSSAKKQRDIREKVTV